MRNNIERSPNFIKKGVLFAVPALSVLALPSMAIAEEVAVDEPQEITADIDEQAIDTSVITIDVDSEVESVDEKNDAVDVWFDEETNTVVPSDETNSAQVEDWFEPFVTSTGDQAVLDNHEGGGEDEILATDSVIESVVDTADHVTETADATEPQEQEVMIEAVTIDAPAVEGAQPIVVSETEDSLELISAEPFAPEQEIVEPKVDEPEILQIPLKVMRSEFSGNASIDAEGDLAITDGFMAINAFGTAGDSVALNGSIEIPAGHGDEQCSIQISSANNHSVRPDSNAHFSGAGTNVSINNVENTAGAVSYTSGMFTPNNDGGSMIVSVDLGKQDTPYGIRGANSFTGTVSVGCDTPEPVVVEEPDVEEPVKEPEVEVPVEKPVEEPEIVVPVEDTPTIETPEIETPVIITPDPVTEVPKPVADKPVLDELPNTGSETQALVSSGLGLALLGGWFVRQSNRAKKLATVRSK